MGARSSAVLIIAMLISSFANAPTQGRAAESSDAHVEPAVIADPSSPTRAVIAAPDLRERRTPSPTVIGSCSGTTYEDTDWSVTYPGGGWGTVYNPYDSGGSIHSSGYGVPDSARAQFRFSGGCVTLVYRQTGEAAKAAVSFDDVAFETFDLCATGTGYQSRRSYAVAAGSHVITVAYGGMGCPVNLGDGDSSGGTVLTIDAFIAPSRGACAISSFYADPPSPTAVGNPNVNLYASVDCGYGVSTLLEFAYQDPATGSWTLITAFGQSPSPAFWQTGCCAVRIDPPYTLRVRAKSSWVQGPAGYEAEATRTHTLTAAENRTSYYFGAGPHFAISPLGVNLANGAFTLAATDLALPGRRLPLVFSRTYNGTDRTAGPFGVAWTHSYNWSLSGIGTSYLTVRRGDGWSDVFSMDWDGCWHNGNGWGGLGIICGNTDGTYTVTLLDQTKYDFSSAGRLTRVKEPSGNHIDLTYSGPYLMSMTDAAGRLITLSYDDQGRITQLTDPLGRRVLYAYDGANRLITVTDLADGVWRYAYQGPDTQRITSVTDPDGRRRVLNSYDAAAKVTSQQEHDGQVTSYGYGTWQDGSPYAPWWPSASLTDPRGTASAWKLDGRGRFRSQTVAGLTASATYDGAGNRLTATDRRGNTTTWTYDSKNNPLTETLPAVAGGTPVWRYDRDAANNAIRITDPLGNAVTRTFNATTNVLLSEVRLFDGATTTYEYADGANPGLPTKITLPRGGYSTFSYDAQGNLAQQIDADGNKTTYAYDAAGRRLTMVDPDGNVSGGTPALHTWQWQYDALDRSTRTTDPLGNTRSWSYDGSGNSTAATDARGNTTTSVYDGRGLFKEVRQVPVAGTTYVTTITRDPSGNATRITQANGVITDYSYDALDRMTAMQAYPAGSAITTSYTLDNNGNVTLRTLPDTAQIAIAYDALDRPTSLSTSGITQTFGYDLMGRRNSAAQTISGATSTWSYTYDAAGRMTSASGPTGSVAYAYDLDSNRTGVTTTVGGVAQTTSYSRSPAGRITNLSEGARISTYTYTPAGRTSQISIANAQLTRDYGYDRAQRLVSVVNRTGAGIIGEFDYTLDPEGNRVSLSENLSGISVPPTMDGFSFSYDGLNRLTSMTGPRSESFTFDGASNITSRSGPSATYAIDGANRPTGDGTAAYTWSNTDRFTSRGADTFGYDNLDRLTQATVGAVTSVFSYDADGLLVNRAGGGVAKDFLWDPASAPQRLLATTTSGSTDRVIYGNGPLYLLRGAAQDPVALVTDGQGSVRAEVSAGQQVTGSWRYELYGKVAQSSGSATPSLLAYTGQLLDPTGLYVLRARWYDPASARFLSRDAGDDGTSSAFTYAAANPMSLYDPAGLSVDPLMGDDCECLAADPVASSPVDPDPPFKCGSDLNCRTVTSPVLESSPSVPSLVLTPIGPVMVNRATPPSAAASTGPGGGGGGAGKDREVAYLYQKLSAAGEHLKFGITNDPANRYTRAELAGGRVKILADGARSEMLKLERNLHETLPLGPEERQAFYIDKQRAKGLRP